MTQEEKDLLLRDLCARLPYGLKILFKLPNYKTDTFKEEIGDAFSICLSHGLIDLHCNGIDYNVNIWRVRPYLRPISNMTKEERQEYGLVLCDELSINQYDWLNSHHFDYRGLIEKGLALEAFEGMYNID